ncbi:MAG: hypothetical protein AB7V08_03575 [Elusimicrobiales bacterium]
MNKKTYIAGVIAFAVAVVLYYDGGRGLLWGDGKKNPPGQPAGGYSIPEDCPADRGYIEALIPAEAGCAESSGVAGVAAEYDKTWGYFRGDPQLSYLASRAAAPEEVEGLKALIGYYHACLSLAEGQDHCGRLVKKREGETGLYDMMYLRCRKTSLQVGLAAYAAGYVNDEAYCAESFRSFLFRDAAGTVSEKQFCATARQGLTGLGAICNSGAGLPCASIFPAEGRACVLRRYDRTDPGDANEALEDMRDCNAYHDFYDAFRAGSPAGLSPEYGALYAAFVSKDGRSCEALGRAVVQGYCSIRHRMAFQQKAEMIRRDFLERDGRLRHRTAEAGLPVSAPPK